MIFLSSYICHLKILEHISCMLAAAEGRDGCNSWGRPGRPCFAHGGKFSAQSLLFVYLLHSEQSQQQVPFGAKCHDLVLGTASIMVQKEKNPASFVTF